MGGTMAAVRASEQPSAEFERELVALIPQIRAFARTFAGHKADGDDLAQETLSRAWSSWTSFQRGSNMKAWAFVILRNVYFSERRRSWRRSSLDPDILARSLVAPDNPDATLALDDLRRGLRQLPDEQRSVILLVGLEGMRYEDVAEVLDVPVGTVRSRLSRGRDALRRLIGSVPDRRAEHIMADACAKRHHGAPAFTAKRATRRRPARIAAR